MKPIRTALSLVLIIIMVYPGYAADKSKETILRINDTNEPPLTTPEKNGFLDVIAGEAFKRAGVTLELIKLPAERALISANAGVDDGDLTRIKGLQKIYPNLMQVPEKLIDWEFSAYSKIPSIEATSDVMQRHVVGYITGWKIYENYLKKTPSVISTKNPTRLFELLERDRIEIALYANWMGEAQIKKLQLTGIHRLQPLIAKREMYIYLHKKHALLIPKIAKALRELKQEGIYQHHYNEKLLQNSYENK